VELQSQHCQAHGTLENDRQSCEAASFFLLRLRARKKRQTLINKKGFDLKFSSMTTPNLQITVKNVAECSLVCGTPSAEPSIKKNCLKIAKKV
jgi:hypothetical protein